MAALVDRGDLFTVARHVRKKPITRAGNDYFVHAEFRNIVLDDSPFKWNILYKKGGTDALKYQDILDAVPHGGAEEFARNAMRRLKGPGTDEGKYAFLDEPSVGASPPDLQLARLVSVSEFSRSPLALFDALYALRKVKKGELTLEQWNSEVGFRGAGEEGAEQLRTMSEFRWLSLSAEKLTRWATRVGGTVSADELIKRSNDLSPLPVLDSSRTWSDLGAAARIHARMAVEFNGLLTTVHLHGGMGAHVTADLSHYPFNIATSRKGASAERFQSILTGLSSPDITGPSFFEASAITNAHAVDFARQAMRVLKGKAVSEAGELLVRTNATLLAAVIGISEITRSEKAFFDAMITLYLMKHQRLTLYEFLEGSEKYVGVTSADALRAAGDPLEAGTRLGKLLEIMAERKLARSSASTSSSSSSSSTSASTSSSSSSSSGVRRSPRLSAARRPASNDRQPPSRIEPSQVTDEQWEWLTDKARKWSSRTGLWEDPPNVKRQRHD